MAIGVVTFFVKLGIEINKFGRCSLGRSLFLLEVEGQLLDFFGGGAAPLLFVFCSSFGFVWFAERDLN